MSNVQSSSLDYMGIIDGLAPVDNNIPAQSDNDQFIAGRIRDLVMNADEARSARSLDMNLFLSALYGDSLLAADPETGTTYRILRPADSELASRNNRLINYDRALWGKLTHTNPDFQVDPGPDASLDEIHGARAAEAFIQQAKNLAKNRKVMSAAKKKVSWSYLGGLVELDWDPQGGAAYCFCQSCGFTIDGFELDGAPCPQCESNQEAFQVQQQQFAQYQADVAAGMAMPGAPPPQVPPPQGELVCLNRGGPTLCAPDPRDVFYQPGVTSMEKMLWYVKREPVPCALVRAMFPEYALEIYPENDVYPSHGAKYTLDPLGDSINERLLDHVYLYTYVERGTALYPDGRRIFCANGRILGQRQAFFRKFGRLPLFRFGWVPIENTPYFRPPLADAWYQQREFDLMGTIQGESAALTSRPKVIVPQGSMVGMGEFTARTGQVILASLLGAQYIRYLQPPQLGADVYARQDKVDAGMRENFGITIQEAGGQTDPNGRYAAIAEAESDQSMGPIHAAHHIEEADMWRCYLILVQMFGDPDEKFTALSDGSSQLYSFQDLKLCANNENVTFIPSDGLSTNPALRRQYAGELMGYGLFGTPGMPDFKLDLFAKFAGIKMPGLVPNPSDPEVQAAVGAIKMLEDGLPYEPFQADDANVFIAVLKNWLAVQGRRQRYSNPQLVQQVVDLMLFYMNKLMMTMGPMQPGAQGPAGPGGGPIAGSGAQSQMSAPGGTPSNEAGQITRNADASAESLARSAASKHEG